VGKILLVNRERKLNKGGNSGKGPEKALLLKERGLASPGNSKQKKNGGRRKEIFSK